MADRVSADQASEDIPVPAETAFVARSCTLFDSLAAAYAARPFDSASARSDTVSAPPNSCSASDYSTDWDWDTVDRGKAAVPASVDRPGVLIGLTEAVGRAAVVDSKSAAVPGH